MSEKQFLIKTVEGFQEIQKRNHPTSLEWIKASKEINAIAKRLATMED